MSTILVGGRTITLSPSQILGKGGEADVYAFGPDKAIKIYKDAGHPDLHGDPVAQQAAQARLTLYQDKLRLFPLSLPPAVVQPETLATDATGTRVVGYVMRRVRDAVPLARYADGAYRAHEHISVESILSLFQEMHATLSQLHQASVVVGDFNDHNVLVGPEGASFIDVDSYSVAPYHCGVFTARFADPLLCQEEQGEMSLTRPFGPCSDWYAFMVLLLQSLLLVDPYGGVYVPPRAADRVPHDLRPLRRITIFDTHVRYPKRALPLAILPDDLRTLILRALHQDERISFPAALLDPALWTRCPSCSLQHGQKRCPTCQTQAQPTHSVRIISGTVRAEQVVQAPEGVLYATVQDGVLRYIVRQGGALVRENGQRLLLPGALRRVRFSGERTLLGESGLVTIMPAPGQGESVSIGVDDMGGAPAFDANARGAYWIVDGGLYRSTMIGPRRLGSVVRAQTTFWVGPAFGIGYYRAGGLQGAFVFDADGGQLNDTVDLPLPSGRIEDIACACTDEYAWVFTTTTTGGRTINHCAIVDRCGRLVGRRHAPAGDDDWLGAIHGAYATGRALFVPTDRGVVRVDLDPASGHLAQTRAFPDTEPFVARGHQLLGAPHGLYVISHNEITSLTIG